MKLMIESCKGCPSIFGCYYNDLERCPKIEMAASGLGIPCKPKKEEVYLRDIPFGVYMGLKHMIERTGDR
jgi:hypothetical protein